jgi:serine/threonine protein kinase
MTNEFPEYTCEHRRVHRGLWSCNHEQDDGIFLRNTVLHEPRYASPHVWRIVLSLIYISESLVPHHNPYSTVQGDIWALGCILAEIIANVRPWKLASPDDRDYSDYLVDRTILYDVLPVSDAAYTLLTKIFSARPERRPSLAAIRAEVLAIDTFFLTDGEAARWGWTDRMAKKLCRKMGEQRTRAVSSRRSEETSSGSCYSCTSGSSSGSCYSCGSSSSAFESISLESSPLPATPPAPAVEVFRSMDKAASRLELGLRVAAAQTA